MNAEIERPVVATANSWEFRFNPLPVAEWVAKHGRPVDSFAASIRGRFSDADMTV
jgi:hypothetical protein